MKTLTKEQAWETLNEQFNVSDETLRIITDINGYKLETMEDVLFSVSGYRSFEQLED